MNKRSFELFRPLIILSLMVLPGISLAQKGEHISLYEKISAMDSLMFEEGFNQCNLRLLEKLLPDDFEFYHDKDGIIRSRDSFLNVLRENLCGGGKNPLRRILVEGSMEVFPLYAENQLYGALQIGMHQFGNTSARFTHLWIKEKEQWVPTRIISYDHSMNRAVASSSEMVNFVQLSVEEQLIYVGEYTFSPDFTLTILFEKGKLYGDADGQKVAIMPYGDHRFLDESQTMNLSFVVDAKGEVSGLEMKGPGGEMFARRTQRSAN